MRSRSRFHGVSAFKRARSRLVVAEDGPPKLGAVTPTGSRVLKRGNPFGGGIGNLDEVLTAVVRGDR